jgi:hypothetical protein
MTPEQAKNGVWFVVLPDGGRIEFESHEAAWRWIDRAERRELWVSSRSQWRVPPSFALPGRST